MLSTHHAVGSSRFEKPSLVFSGSFLSTSQPPPQGPIHSPSAKLFGDLGDSVTATPKSNPWDTCTAQSCSAKRPHCVLHLLTPLQIRCVGCPSTTTSQPPRQVCLCGGLQHPTTLRGEHLVDLHKALLMSTLPWLLSASGHQSNLLRAAPLQRWQKFLYSRESDNRSCFGRRNALVVKMGMMWMMGMRCP